MMDREASLAPVQIGFIDHVAKGVYQDVAGFSPELRPLLDGVVANREKWRRIKDGEDEDDFDAEEAVRRMNHNHVACNNNERRNNNARRNNSGEFVRNL